MDGRLSAAPDHPNLAARKTPGATKTRQMQVLAGTSTCSIWASFNNTFLNLLRAVKERVFFVKSDEGFVTPPKPKTRRIFFSRLSCFVHDIRCHLPSTVPITRRQFVDTYQGRKRVVYENALSSLGVAPLAKKDSYVKVFIKYEKTDFYRKSDPVPRVISPRSPRFNVEYGRYIRPIEERLYESISLLFGSVTVMKGLNALDMASAIQGKWERFKDPVAVGADASRFDQHVSREALEFEHSIYASCFWHPEHRRKFSRLAAMQLQNYCFGNVPDGEVRYTVDGVRMSGDMNTGLGNCVLMCAMFYSYAKSKGVPIELANNGDDCVVFMERTDYDRFVSGLDVWFRELGFNVILENPVYDIEKIVFCQTQPVMLSPGRYIMVRDPRVAISKDATCVTPLRTEKDFNGWVSAVGVGGLALTPGMPVWQNFYNCLVRSGALGPRSNMQTGWGWGVRKLGSGMRIPNAAPSACSRFSFWIAFGISPDEQLCIEKFYDSLLVTYGDNPDVPDFRELPL